MKMLDRIGPMRSLLVLMALWLVLAVSSVALAAGPSADAGFSNSYTS